MVSFSSGRSERDARDIGYILTHYWDDIDINRIPENDMVQFVQQYPAAASAWSAIKRKYR
jgi:hypothetical protein